MDKKLIVAAFVILALIGAGLAFLIVQNLMDTPAQTNSQEEQPAASNEQAGNSAASGIYTDYNESLLASTEGTKVIFFYAPWCPQCRALEKDIKANGVPSGVTIFKTDYDSSTELRQKYGVTIQTTLVKVDNNGELIEKFVAYDEPTIDSVDKNLLR